MIGRVGTRTDIHLTAYVPVLILKKCYC